MDKDIVLHIQYNTMQPLEKNEAMDFMETWIKWREYY